MINLNEHIIIFNNQIPFMYIFIAIGVFLWFFIFWREGKKDGFNEKKIFDYTFLSSIVCTAISYYLFKYFEWHRLYRPTNWLLAYDLEITAFTISVLMSVIILIILSKKWRWSVFRLLDIHSLSLTFLFLPVSIGLYLIYSIEEYSVLSISLIIVYVLVLRLRGYRLTSGYIFSFFMVFIGSVVLALFQRKGYVLYASVFFGFGVINFFLRRRKIMDKKSLPREFIDKMKSILQKKEKKLTQEELLLKSQDPYMQPGRASDNSEIMDEAILEDHAKEQFDNRMSFIQSVKSQVTKAIRSIGQGTYGKCEVCGKDIDKARLKAFPEATKCLECAQDAEDEDDID